jgi:hypothetical protein
MPSELNVDDGSYLLRARLNVSVQDIDRDVARQLVHRSRRNLPLFQGPSRQYRRRDELDLNGIVDTVVQWIGLAFSEIGATCPDETKYRRTSCLLYPR